MSALEELAATWRSARRVAVLTGAGISTASGIPDFRSPGGRWERYQPVPLPEFLASAAARATYWRYKGETWQLIRTAEPNPAHDALAALAHAGRLDLLVTQNVDGLHERSGFPAERLVNIHGTDSAVECMACHRRAARGCDLFVAAGTSLVVGPINQMFAAAHAAGARTAILTASETPYDDAADWTLPAPLAEVLSELARLVLEDPPG